MYVDWCVHLSECMINMETSQPEAFPQGWWDLVVNVRAVTRTKTQKLHNASNMCNLWISSSAWQTWRPANIHYWLLRSGG